MISIIVPVLNEAGLATNLARRLQALEARGAEVIVVDGGSKDATPALLAQAGIEVVTSSAGRARQMNCGAVQAKGEALLFLHADTLLPDNAITLVESALSGDKYKWGRFDVRISGHSRWLPMVAFLMNWRSRLTGIATGDQAMFVRADVFSAIGGFADQPLMEDIDFCVRLRKQVGCPACLRQKVITSGRRWDTKGVWPTIWLMWRLRWAYWRGVSPEQLAADYQ